MICNEFITKIKQAIREIKEHQKTKLYSKRLEDAKNFSKERVRCEPHKTDDKNYEMWIVVDGIPLIKTSELLIDNGFGRSYVGESEIAQKFQLIRDRVQEHKLLNE